MYPNENVLISEVSSNLDNHVFAKGDFANLRFYELDTKHYIIFSYIIVKIHISKEFAPT